MACVWALRFRRLGLSSSPLPFGQERGSNHIGQAPLPPAGYLVVVFIGDVVRRLCNVWWYDHGTSPAVAKRSLSLALLCRTIALRPLFHCPRQFVPSIEACGRTRVVLDIGGDDVSGDLRQGVGACFGHFVARVGRTKRSLRKLRYRGNGPHSYESNLREFLSNGLLARIVSSVAERNNAARDGEEYGHDDYGLKRDHLNLRWRSQDYRSAVLGVDKRSSISGCGPIRFLPTQAS